MEFFAPEIIGPKRRLTPSGTLICYEVPIARTGTQTYRDGEVPVAPGANGSILVQRDPEEVFHPDAIASFEGVPIVNEHPMADVTPHNWRHLSMGHCQNVRRGDGIQDHLLLADLVIQDAAMIRAIEDGKREISCGYSADYEETGPGTARQINIRGNHCAVVESARCGPQCSIQDHNHRRVEDKGPDTMPKSKFAALVSRALFVRDAEEAEKIKKEAEEMEEGEGGSTPGAHHQVVNIHPPSKEDDDDEDDPAVEQLSQQVQAMQQQHEEMLADLDMLLEESEAGGEEDSKRWNDERDKRDAADARGRRLDAARGRQRDRAARHADRRQHDSRSKHHADARRRLDDARRRLDSARDRMEEDGFRRHDESLREMDSRLRRHGDNGMRDYNDEEMKGCEDAMKRWDDDFNSSASPIEPTEAILASLEMEAPPGTNDQARRAKDSQYLEDSYRETVSMAEIIVPGIKVPTFDRAAKPKVTFDSICALRRQALEQAYATPELKPTIDVLASGRWEPAKMTCDQMRPIFIALALQRKIANNAATAGGGGERRTAVPTGPMSLADIQKMHDEHWKGRVH